jgi:pimeloyl-ACP methyl ester carboxylesterase
MRIETYGSGPKLFVGLHGWNGDHRTFLPLVDDLPPGVTFMAVDLPGCGTSPPPARWDLDSITDEIAGCLHSEATLVGNCSGAILALLAARKAPERVNRVVLIDAFAAWPWYFRVFLSPTFGRLAYYTAFANPLGRWLTNLSLASKRKSETDLTRGFAAADHASTYRYLTLLAQAGSAQSFASLSCPVDVLYGARSFAAVRQSARRWAEVWPHARLFELEGAGHLPILEAAPQVKQILFRTPYLGEDPCIPNPATYSQTCAL